MNHGIKLVIDGCSVLEVQTSLNIARKLALMSLVLPEFAGSYPDLVSAYTDCLCREIKRELPPHILHQWIKAEQCSSAIIEVDIYGVNGRAGEASFFDGGCGGQGAWPGGGGGGGGNGLSNGGYGGAGADGACLVIQWSVNINVFDIQVFVMPGQHTWYKKEGAEFFMVYMWGGGGGGGGGSLK